MSDSPPLDAMLQTRDAAIARGVTFADCRYCRRESRGIVLEDGRADRAHAWRTEGVAVRVLVDGGWGLASSDGTDLAAMLESLEAACHMARCAARHVREAGAVVRASGPAPAALTAASTPESKADAQIAALMNMHRAAAAAAGGRLCNAIFSLGVGRRVEHAVNTFGDSRGQASRRSLLTAALTGADGEVRQQVSSRVGAVGETDLLGGLDGEAFAVEAAGKLLGQLAAGCAPAGVFDCIFHPSMTGLFAHEVVGHAAEADSVWAGESVFAGRLGDTLAAAGVTVVDDPTLAAGYGYSKMDSEGSPCRRNVILQDGRLVGWLHSLETAARMGAAPNGCGRAEDHTCRPIVRMSNTFFAPGGDDVTRMIRDTDRGVYLEDSRGGYVMIERGRFHCHAAVARRIEHGALGERLRDVAVSGDVFEALAGIDRVGSDFQMADPGPCGRAGQSVPTDCGGPHLRVRNLLVGGSET